MNSSLISTVPPISREQRGGQPVNSSFMLTAPKVGRRNHLSRVAYVVVVVVIVVVVVVVVVAAAAALLLLLLLHLTSVP